MNKLPCLKRLAAICAVVAAGVAFGAASDLPQRDSATFDFKYEMESLPTEEDLDWDGRADFTMNNSGWLTNGDFNYARFGTASQTSHGGSFEVDYVRWTTDGVFAPFIPPKGTYLLVR